MVAEGMVVAEAKIRTYDTRQIEVSGGVRVVNLNETSDGPVKVITVSGRLDGASAPVLGERLNDTLAPTRQKLLLELSELEYISSAGFRVLLIAAKRANESNGQIVLSGIAGHVRQLFEIGGFLKLFRIFGTRDEGLSALR